MTRRGFTLLEMMVVLVIGGLMTSFMLTVASSADKVNYGECNLSTRSQLNYINAQIEAFARKHDRLPMPAARNLGVDQLLYGRETSGGNITSIGGTSWGSLPFQALGIPVSYMTDCWGNKFSYVVTTALTTNASSGGFLDSTVLGNITVRTTATVTKSTTAAYAVISHGEDGLGAVKNNYTWPNAGGTPDTAHKWCTGASTLRTMNCLATAATVADGVYNNGKDAGANYFDDVMVASGKPGIIATNSIYTAYGWGWKYGSYNWSTFGTDAASNVSGDGANLVFPVPVKMPIGVTFSNIAVGSGGSWRGGVIIAIGNDGNVYNWGLSPGLSSASGYPIKLTPPVGVTLSSPSVGFYHVCTLGSDGNVYCWGHNGFGGLGRATSGSSILPTTLPGGVTAFTSVSVGGNGLHSCAMGNDSRAYCWGYNNFGQIGDGFTATRTTATRVELPVAPGTATAYTAVTAGDNHSCGLGDDGQAYCWGVGTSGELGDGTIISKPLPVQVTMPTLPVGNEPTAFIDIRANGAATCATGNNNRLYCWGWNGNGLLGDGTTTNRNVPTLVTLPAGVTSFTNYTVGKQAICATGNNGVAYCAGGGVYNMQVPQRNTQTAISLPSGATSILAFGLGGENNTCLVTNQGKAYCTGFNFYGQVGNYSGFVPSNDLVLPTGFTGWKNMSTNGSTSCGIGSNDVSYCWGYNGFGTVGDNTTVSKKSPTAVMLPATGATSFTQVAVGGGSFVCAIGNNGLGYCWGANWVGELGTGNTTWYYRPTAVVMPGGVTSFTSISAGTGYACAIGNNGQGYCWGTGTSNQLGNGAAANRTSPTLVTLPSGVTSWKLIVANSGGTHTCGIGNNDQAYCWGTIAWGNLGTGASSSSVPALVTNPTGVTGWTDITSAGVCGGACGWSCGIGNNGLGYCWGYSTTDYSYAGYVIGDGAGVSRATPTMVTMPSGVTSFTKIKADGLIGFNCAIGNDGKVYCWGNNTFGTFGTNTTTNRTTPTSVIMPSSVSKFKDITIGYNYVFGLAEDRPVYGWGYNALADLGNDSTTSPNLVPKADMVLPTIVAPDKTIGFKTVCGGYGGSCGIAKNGQAYCWGGFNTNSWGQIGDGTTWAVRLKPTAVVKPGAISSWTSISCGNYAYNCGIGDNGLAYCWGSDEYGQHGVGTNWTQRSSPTQVTLPSGVTTWKSAEAGHQTTCGIGDNDQGYCWGYGAHGNIGDGVKSNRLLAQLITLPGGVTGWTYITPGVYRSSCAIGNNGEAYCWGWNSFWQLGVGNNADAYWAPSLVTRPAGVTSWLSIKPGYTHTCGLGNNGQVYCWGAQTQGQMGIGSASGNFAAANTAVTLPSGVTSFTKIETSWNHSCALGNDGKVYCWGLNSSAELGDGTTTDRWVPTLATMPSGVTEFRDISLGLAGGFAW